MADAAHIARHDPARVLAEVDAKRRLLDEILWYESMQDGDCGCGHGPDAIAAGECKLGGGPDRITAFRILALPYAAHPDYQDAWRP